MSDVRTGDIQSTEALESLQGENSMAKSNATEEEPTNTQVKPYSSYASLVNPNEGTELQFVPAEIINGMKVAKIDKVRKGVFLVHFGNIQDKQALEKRGIYYFDAKPFLLDTKFWGNDSFSKIRSTLGSPLKTYKYARLLINISLDGLFPDYIEFFNENQVSIRQQVIYEWKPT
ncbi:hypothetical protein Cgig2_023657 [Carnegiea gigantea]|uniref:Uncharacterized protein n=1 Tax=Carnegiea gigantea TaxID=171969 RepID=A0A9Q1JGR8_9CARY|nr:hypothetical protein Cgig2_023657 [Carnegiea gigantea]